MTLKLNLSKFITIENTTRIDYNSIFIEGSHSLQYTMSGQDTQVSARITRSLKTVQPTATDGKNLETTRITRSLKTVQPTAADSKNLVGRPSKRFKHQISQENSEPIEVKKKNVASKETQANLEGNITEEDLINPDEASGKYWQKLAEKRQIALQEVLEKNEKLHEIIEDFKKENAMLKQMVNEANSFVEIVKEELASNSTNDDTGIDVNDVSTADDTAEETNEVSSNDDN